MNNQNALQSIAGWSLAELEAAIDIELNLAMDRTATREQVVESLGRALELGRMRSAQLFPSKPAQS